MKNKADRHNEGKPRLSYVLEFEDALVQIADKMTAGAAKYERNNWRKGQPISDLADSAMRHLLAFMSGEDVDPEDGTHSLAGVLTNVAFMLHTIRYHPEFDDRYKESHRAGEVIELKEGVRIGDIVRPEMIVRQP